MIMDRSVEREILKIYRKWFGVCPQSEREKIDFQTDLKVLEVLSNLLGKTED